MVNLSFDINTKLLRENILSPLIDIGLNENKLNLHFTENGINIKQTNATNVVGINFFLHKLDDKVLSNYVFDSKEETYCVDIFTLVKYISSIEKASFELDEKNKCFIIKYGIYTYNIGLKTLGKSVYPSKMKKGENLIKMKGEDLLSVFRECFKTDELVSLNLKGEDDDFSLVFSSNKQGLNDKVIVSFDEFNVISYKVLKNIDLLKFNIVYTKSIDVFSKTIKNIEEIELYIQDSYPIFVLYNITEQGHSKSEILLAPYGATKK